MPPEPARHVLVLGGIARSLVNFRGPLIRELIARGHRVTAAAGDSDPSAAATLSAWGVPFRRVRLDRAGMNPAADIAGLTALTSLMRRERPDVFLGYTVKPVVYGLLAARLAGIERRVAMVEGLGYAFSDGNEPGRRAMRWLVSMGYRTSLPFADALIVLNRDDERFFREGRFLRPSTRLDVVPGTGIDLDHYGPAPLPAGPPTFLMIARLLGDKGVREFVAAARLTKRQHEDARFVLVGRFDRNPAAITPAEVEAWSREGIVVYAGAVDDVRPAIASCHVFVLPTRYREGLPRTILEAMAMARAVVATDTPGCRDAVIDGKTGLLVPPGDPDALAAAMTRFARDPAFAIAAGEAGLAACRAQFDTKSVVPRLADLVTGTASA
jgi:glycosyltransferase involved in cell wall biosynthesis